MTDQTVTCPACSSTLELRVPASGTWTVSAATCPNCGQTVPLHLPPASGNVEEPDSTLPAPAQERASAAEGQDSPREPTAGQWTLAAPQGPPRSGEFPFLAPPQQLDELGRLGPYRVLGLLGEGGMGVVFRAEDPTLRRQVALKVMLPHFARDPVAKARFLREARAQAAVDHDHIISIYQVGEERDVAFITMPLLKGLSLADALKANPLVPVGEAVRIAREMAEGLAAAHECGLVHRDIKPANVWLEGQNRQVKILDFGLARAASQTEGAEQVTQQGAIIGTPAYMSPEQATGEPVDSRTDLFSLGVVLYQMLTGQRPFTGKNSPAVLISVVSHSPPRPAALNPQVPSELDALTMRLLAKGVANRPPTAEEVVDALLAVESSMNRTRQLSAVAPASPDPWESIANTDPEPGAVVEPRQSVSTTGVDTTPVQGQSNSRGKGRPWVMVAALLVFGGLAVVAADIIIKIKNKDGSETEIKLPDTATVTVTKDGKELGKFGPEPAKKDLPIPVTPPAAEPKDDPIDYAAERRAAETLLKAESGHLAVILADGKWQGRSLAEWRAGKLPEGPFHIEGAQLRSSATDEVVASLAPCSRLVHLTVGTDGITNPVGDAGFKMLRGFPRLRELYLRNVKFGDAGFGFVRGCPQLMNLDIIATKITEEGLTSLRHCPQLRAFFAPPGLTESGLATVVANCRELRSLTLIQSKTSLRPLAALPRLRHLHCSNESLDDDSAIALGKVPYLESLNCDYPTPAAFARLAPLNGRLRTLISGRSRSRRCLCGTACGTAYSSSPSWRRSR